MGELEYLCLQIISSAGEARSECMAAMEASRNRCFDEADLHMSQAAEHMKEAHQIHTQLLTKDAAGELGPVGLVLIHSEDIMMGTEITHALAGEIMEVHRLITRS